MFFLHFQRKENRAHCASHVLTVLQTSQQKRCCGEMPDAKFLVLHSDGLDLSTKKGKKALCKASENEPYGGGESGSKSRDLSSP